MPTRGAVAGLCAVLFLLAACGTGSSGTPAPFATYDRTGQDAGDAALVEGTLTLVNGCVYLDSGDERWLPVFPAGATQWDPGTSTVTLSGHSATPGTPTGLGGSEGDASIITSAPDGCDRTKVWVVTTLGLPTG